MPAIGQNLDVNLTDLTATNLPLILIGTATTPPTPMSLIFPGSGAACSVQMNPALVAVGGSWAFVMPNTPALVSQVLYAQGVQLDVNFSGANTKVGAFTLGEF